MFHVSYSLSCLEGRSMGDSTGEYYQGYILGILAVQTRAHVLSRSQRCPVLPGSLRFELSVRKP